MMKTFNCGVGFCLIVDQRNTKKIKKNFPKKFTPYEIGRVTNNTKRVKLVNNLKW